MDDASLATILIVAGDEGHLRWLAAAFSPLGAEVQVARTGQEALEYLSEQDPALVVLWDELLDMAGTEVASLLRGDRTKTHIPIVLVASDARWEEISTSAFEVGILDRVRHPVRQSVLVGKARIFVEMHAARVRAQQHRERLERSNRDLRDFAHAAAHDLRAPLRAIACHTRFLARPDVESDKRDHHYESVLQTVGRMEALIGDMLGYASVDGTRVDQGVDLDVCLKDVLLDFEERIEAREARIEADPLPDVTGSSALLRCLLQNLLGNALDHTRPDIQPEIRVTAEVRGGTVEVRVADNGPGFDMEWAEDIFKPFRRLSPRTSASGSGVGLATARRIVERHGGSLGVNSVLGEGSVFFFRLPVTAAQIAAFHRRQEAHLASRGPRFMLVDDDPMDRRCSLLALEGMEVTVFESAEDALEGLPESVDVVIADHRMPGEGGLWLFRKLRESRPAVLRILVTGAEDDACKEAVREGLVLAVLPKPVDREAVMALVGTGLSGSGTRSGPPSSASSSGEPASVSSPSSEPLR